MTYRPIYVYRTGTDNPREENNDNKDFWQLEDSSLLPGLSKALEPVQLEKLGGQRKG
jgi:hypothetical protein